MCNDAVFQASLACRVNESMAYRARHFPWFKVKSLLEWGLSSYAHSVREEKRKGGKRQRTTTSFDEADDQSFLVYDSRRKREIRTIPH
jgi:hypothetical protein